MAALRFVFDQHINAPALKQLRNDGIDVVHVAEVGLAEADDPEILGWAVREERIVVTRNYRDFAPLAQAYVRQGVPCPGILFYARSVRHSDVGHHVRALRSWIREAEEAEEAGEARVKGGLGWLR